MDSSPTLQDFILNLIYDPDARSAFELDPHGTLDAAGLGDVSAADVQDVLPLVLDYAPLASGSTLPGLIPADDLTTGVAHLDVAGAVAQLQAITAQISGLPSHVTADLNFTAAGTITVTADYLAPGMLSTGTGLLGHAGAGAGVSTVPAVHADVQVGGLDAGHDPAAGLDAAVTTTLEHVGAGAGAGVGLGSSGVEHVSVDYSAESLISGAGVTGTLDATVNTITGVTGSLGAGVTGSLGAGIDDLDVAGVHEATSSVVGAVGVGGLLPDGNVVDGAAAAVDHTVSGVTGLVGGSAEPAPQPGHDGLGGLTGLHF